MASDLEKEVLFNSKGSPNYQAVVGRTRVYGARRDKVENLTRFLNEATAAAAAANPVPITETFYDKALNIINSEKKAVDKDALRNMLDNLQINDAYYNAAKFNTKRIQNSIETIKKDDRKNQIVDVFAPPAPPPAPAAAAPPAAPPAIPAAPAVPAAALALPADIATLIANIKVRQVDQEMDIDADAGVGPDFAVIDARIAADANPADTPDLASAKVLQAYRDEYLDNMFVRQNFTQDEIDYVLRIVGDSEFKLRQFAEGVPLDDIRIDAVVPPGPAPDPAAQRALFTRLREYILRNKEYIITNLAQLTSERFRDFVRDAAGDNPTEAQLNDLTDRFALLTEDEIYELATLLQVGGLIDEEDELYQDKLEAEAKKEEAVDASFKVVTEKKVKRYHPNSLMLFYGADITTGIDWDDNLKKSVEAMSLTKKEIIAWIDDVISEYGKRIYVRKRLSATKEELIEVLQMAFSLEKPHLGTRYKSGSVKLTDLAKLGQLSQVAQAQPKMFYPGKRVETVRQLEPAPRVAPKARNPYTMSVFEDE